ncbi:MAG: AAA family ATPase [Alphaproteobacteria bacterium]|nr:AAA family ATPase [Alphaproteobacteria bacterium]
MKVIAVIAQKGGAGKTTLSIGIAVAAKLDGLIVAVIDLDAQATAANWGDRRKEEEPVVISAQATRLEKILGAARGQGADLVVIDTAPRAEQGALAAAQAADLVLIPCRAAIYDLETVRTTVELVRLAGNPPAAVVLNGIPPRGTREQQAREVLAGLGAAVCPAGLGHRAAIDHAATLGLSVQEYEPRGKAAEEMAAVYIFAKQLVNSTTQQGVIHNGETS